MNDAAHPRRRARSKASSGTRRQARLPDGARAQGAVAVDLDDSQRQSSEAEPRRAQGRRTSGVECLRRDSDDGTLFRCAAPAGPGRGQAACLAGLSRHPVPARASDARQAGEVSRVRWRPILPVTHQGRRNRRFLDRIGWARRRHDLVRIAGAGLSPTQASGSDRRPAGPNDRARRRCRTRRGQYLRGIARRLEARRPQSLVGNRLQPPEPRRGGFRPAVRPHRRDVRDDGLARRHAEIRAAPGSGLRPARRRIICASGSMPARTRSIRRWSTRAAKAGASIFTAT